MDATEVRSYWAAANGVPAQRLKAFPTAAFAPLARWPEDVLAEAATRAVRRDEKGKLRPTAWSQEADRLGDLLARHGRCTHALLPSTCPACPVPTAQNEASPGRRTSVGTPPKAESVKELCALLGVPNMGIGVGSSIYSDLFRLMAARTGVPAGSMPQVGQAVAAKADVPWDHSCDSRSTPSNGGSTVTGVGLARLVTALRRLL